MFKFIYENHKEHLLKNTFLFYLKLETNSLKHRFIVVFLLLLPLFFVFIQKNVTETVADIAQARLSSIDIALQSYQKIDLTDVENTDERYLSLIDQSNALATMTQSAMLENRQRYLFASIDYGEKMGTFYEQYAAESDRSLFPKQSTVVQETSEFTQVLAKRKEFHWNQQGFSDYWKTVFLLYGALLFYLTVFWSADLFLSEVKRPQFSNSVPFRKRDRIFIPIIIRLVICTIGTSLFLISAVFCSFFFDHVDFSYPFAYWLREIQAVEFLLFLLLYFLMTIVITGFAICLTSFIFTVTKDVLQTCLLASLLGALPLIVPSRIWLLTPFQFLNVFQLLQGDYAFASDWSFYSFYFALILLLIYTVALFWLTTQRLKGGLRK